MAAFLARLYHWWTTRRTPPIGYDAAWERVQRGAAYLDSVDPGWHHRVDLVSLELASGSSCVLGQLHGAFRMGLSRSQLINLSSAPRASLSPVDYGFQCVQGVADEAQDRDYRHLNRAWQEAVRRRYADEDHGVRGGLHTEAPAKPSEAPARPPLQPA